MSTKQDSVHSTREAANTRARTLFFEENPWGALGCLLCVGHGVGIMNQSPLCLVYVTDQGPTPATTTTERNVTEAQTWSG